jgi:hypothetical protein
MTKRVCALLLVFTAFGAVVGTTAPAEAQTPPAQVAFWTRNRSVSFTSNFVHCYDWQYNTGTRVLVPRGSSTVAQDSWYVCRNLQTGQEIVADLFVHAGYRSDGWTSRQYELRVRVNWGGGTVHCGSIWGTTWLARYVNSGFTMFWSQAMVTSTTDGSWRYLNCQHMGNVGMYFRVEEGLGTW